MGDASDHADIDRFMRSAEGKTHLDEIRRMLVGRTIKDVVFSNDTHFITTLLHMDDGETFVVFQPSLKVEAIQEQFEDVLEREYFEDYPERKPN